jgi:hypothetical protein
VLLLETNRPFLNQVHNFVFDLQNVLSAFEILVAETYLLRCILRVEHRDQKLHKFFCRDLRVEGRACLVHQEVE